MTNDHSEEGSRPEQPVAVDQAVVPDNEASGLETVISVILTESSSSDAEIRADSRTTPENFLKYSTANHIALPQGYQLQEYVIQTVLGSGGFGITYLARDENLRCPVAIKEYLPNGVAVRMNGQTVCPVTDLNEHDYREGLDRFLNETRVLASFRHPNIVHATRFFEANNTAYMVMDYEKGLPLRLWAKDRGDIAESLLLQMFLPLLDGLETVHQAGVLHRDIKPANIYVREGDGSLVLLDFGAARYASAGTSRSLTSMVTPGYAPLEQYHTRGAQGPWSDIYALGGVLYWLVTGQKPNEAPSRIKSDSMPTAELLAAGRYKKSFLRAIDWALLLDEEARPRNVADFKAALMGKMPVPARQPSPTLVPSNSHSATQRRGVAMGLLAAALSVAAGAYWLMPGESDDRAASFVEPPKDVAVTNPPLPQPAADRPSPSPTPASKTVDAKDKVPGKPAKLAHKDSPRSTSDAKTPANSVEKQEAVIQPTSTLVFDVYPYGDVFVDGKKVGTSPPMKSLSVSPGAHKIEVRGSSASANFYQTVELAPAAQQKISVNFTATRW